MKENRVTPGKGEREKEKERQMEDSFYIQFLTHQAEKQCDFVCVCVCVLLATQFFFPLSLKNGHYLNNTLVTLAKVYPRKHSHSASGFYGPCSQSVHFSVTNYR